MSLDQAVRNGIEAELAAARFYEQLLAKAVDDETRAFFEQMIAQERAHAEGIEREGLKLVELLPSSADMDVTRIETAPGWGDAGEISLAQALELAIEAENQAALYYDAIADFLEGAGAEFFRQLSAVELDHAEQIRAKLEQLGEGGT